MKKQILLFVMVLVPMLASADAVEIDGIYYNLITKAKEAEVTKNPNRNSFLSCRLYYSNRNAGCGLQQGRLHPYE